MGPWRRRAGAVSLAVVAAGLLAGCAAVPEPFSDADRFARVETDVSAMFADQEPIAGPIGLYEAIARGLKYNLDKRLKTMERALVEKGSEHLAAGLLPQRAVNAGYRARDDFRASSSRSISTGRESLEVSTSEDKELWTDDLQVVWNVLDFGLTYLRSRQEADRVLIAEERRIKVVQNMIMDIRDAYWRAIAAERMLPRVTALTNDVEAAIGRSRKVASAGSGEPGDELKLQRDLLANLKDLKEVRRRLSLARAELAGLINLPPGTRFTLEASPIAGARVPRVLADVGELERLALANRPELREEDYKKRISEVEVRAAHVRLLPGFEIRAGVNYDSNSFLHDADWTSLAGILTKNLMELATADRAIAFAEQDVTVADARRLSLSMAVVTQLHIALQRFALATDVYQVNARLLEVDSKLSTIATDGAEATATAEIEALAARTRKVVSELSAYAAYADSQAAYGRILNSIGAYRIPSDFDALDVATLEGEMRRILEDWRTPHEELKVASK